MLTWRGQKDKPTRHSASEATVSCHLMKLTFQRHQGSFQDTILSCYYLTAVGGSIKLSSIWSALWNKWATMCGHIVQRLMHQWSFQRSLWKCRKYWFFYWFSGNISQPSSNLPHSAIISIELRSLPQQLTGQRQTGAHFYSLLPVISLPDIQSVPLSLFVL